MSLHWVTFLLLLLDESTSASPVHSNSTTCVNNQSPGSSKCPLWTPKQNKTRLVTDGVRVDLTDAMNNHGATCLDGSVPVFYFRPGSGDGEHKFHVFFEGGGACVGVNEALSPRCFNSCAARAQESRGSSTNYPIISDYDSEYLSTNFVINPLTYNWNTIYVKYCDGGMFLGDNSTVQPTANGQLLHYRGRRIVIGVFEELINSFNFGAATDVVVSGCSAGGVAVYGHGDMIKKEFVPPDAMFMTMPDSAFFLEYEGDFINVMEWIYENMNIFPSLNEECVDHYGEDNAFECLFAENNAQFISVLTLALQSQYDLFQLDCELGSYWPGDVNQYAALFRDTFFSTFVSEGPYHHQHAAFLDSCSRHCGQWNQITAEGMRSPQVMMEWYHHHQPEDKHIWFQNWGFPCLLCCPTFNP